MKADRGYRSRLSLSLLLLLTAAGQAERNPFQPLNSGCESSALPFHWQLKGIVGQADDFHAWLMAKKGKWVQLSQGQQLDERWQLQHITALSITLSDINGCEPPFKRNLRGSIYEKDTLSAVADGNADPVTG